MKKIILALPLIFTLLGLGIWVLFTKILVPPQAKHIHIHAGFQVYKDGKLVNFSQDKYMHEVPCTLTEEKDKPFDAEEEQMDKAHLHDRTGDLVHVHREGATWGDLFTNLQYLSILSKGSEISNFKLYNAKGEEIHDGLNQPIKAYESVIFLEGENKDIKEYLPKAVTKSYIQQKEKRSENCGS